MDEKITLSSESNLENKPTLLDLIDNLEIYQSWDCYNDEPSDMYYISVRGVDDNE